MQPWCLRCESCPTKGTIYTDLHVYEHSAKQCWRTIGQKIQYVPMYPVFNSMINHLPPNYSLLNSCMFLKTNPTYVQSYHMAKVACERWYIVYYKRKQNVKIYMQVDKYLRWKPCLCRSQLQMQTETLHQEHRFLLSTPYSSFCASHNIKTRWSQIAALPQCTICCQVCQLNLPLTLMGD